MTIFINDNGTYGIRGKYKTMDGHWKSYKMYSGKNGITGKRNAERIEKEFLDKMEGKANLNIIERRFRISFKEVCDIYFEDAKRTLKTRTIISNKEILKSQFKNLDDCLITRISTQHLKEIIYGLDDRGYSMSYVGRAYYTAKKIFRFAYEKGYLLDNPMDKIDPVKRPDMDNDIYRKIKYWTPEQFKLFISNVDIELYYTYFSFLYFTGCRRGEASALKWSDLDFTSETFSIDKTYFAKNGQSYFTTPKTKNSFRKKKMPKVLVDIMNNWLTHQKEQGYGKSDDFIFGGSKPITNPTVDRYYKKYKSFEKTLPDIPLHGLRHSHVSFLINNEADAYDVANRIGDTVDTVNKVYYHFFESREKEIINIIDKYNF